MSDSGSKISRLAAASLTISIVWLIGAGAAMSSLFWYRWSDPQGWDKLALLITVFVGSLVVLLVSTILSLTALLQIKHSQGRIVGRGLAIAGMVLAALPAGVLLWAMYG